MKKIFALILVVMTLGCTDLDRKSSQVDEIDVLEANVTSSSELKTEEPTVANEQIATFLTFQDYNAEAAMNFYIGLFEDSKVLSIQRHEKGAAAKEGSIMFAKFELNGSLFACSDSPPIHEWGFTPAVSNFVECRSEEEIEMLYSKLSEGGQVMMPLDNYGWSTKFGFVVDRFGVSWQLNLL